MVFIKLRSSLFKKFKRVFLTLLLAFITVSYSTTNVFAANPCPYHGHANWWECAYTFYQNYPTKQAKYDLTGNTGSFFYTQKGVTRSSNYDYYGIIGFNFYVAHGGQTFKGALGKQLFTDIGDERVNGYTYSLWRVYFDDIMKSLQYYNPGVDFSFMYDRSFSTRVVFDAICTRYRNGVPQGSVDNYGKPSGTVMDSFTDPDWPYYVKPTEKLELFSIVGYIPPEQKPVPNYQMSITSFPFGPGQSATYPGAKYVNGNDYWVNLRDPFTIYSESTIDKSYGFTDTNYISLDVNGDRSPQNTSIAYDVGVAGMFDSHFWMQGWNPSTSDANPGKNYRYSRFVMKAQNDNYDYNLSHTVSKGGYSLPHSATQYWIKTDGTPPATNFEPAHGFSSANDLRILQQNIYDTRSGLNHNSIYAYVYKEGSSDKGARIPLVKVNQYSDWGATINVEDYGHLQGQHGNFIVEVWASDNVENEGMVSSKTVERVLPDPIATDILIKDYEYEDSTTKWVRANDEFQIYQNGYQVGMNPTQSNIRISETEDYQNSQVSNAYAMTIHNYGTWGSNTPHIVKNRDTLLGLSNSIENGEDRRYGTGEYYFFAEPVLNGKKFHVYGSTEVQHNGRVYESIYLKEPKLLGIDAVGPTIEYEFLTNSTIRIRITDNESGVRETTTIDDRGNVITGTTELIVTLAEGKGTIITARDNVGNETVVDVSPVKEEITDAFIDTEEVVVDGKKKLKVTAGYGYRGIADSTDINLSAFGDGTSNGVIYSSQNELRYEFYIEDIYNQTYGPNLAYNGNNIDIAEITIEHIEDIIKDYLFKLEENRHYSRFDWPTQQWEYWDTGWRNLTEKTVQFASGRHNYRVDLVRESDKNFNPITPEIKFDGYVNEGPVNMELMETGDYTATVTMYDYNGNPSGTSVLKFRHIKPIINEKFDLEVTAVKDISWEGATYPIKYNSVDFPLGLNYKFKENLIKLGYSLSFNLENPAQHNISNYKITYELTDGNGSSLKAYSNGKLLEDSDSQDGTNYLTQNGNFIVENNRLYLKHFLPADAQFISVDGQPYSGVVKVKMKVYMYEGHGYGVNTFDLYAVPSNETAYDDLRLDKQR